MRTAHPEKAKALIIGKLSRAQKPNPKVRRTENTTKIM